MATSFFPSKNRSASLILRAANTAAFVQPPLQSANILLPLMDTDRLGLVSLCAGQITLYPSLILVRGLGGNKANKSSIPLNLGISVPL